MNDSASTRNVTGQSVAREGEGAVVVNRFNDSGEGALFDLNGRRKYLTQTEAKRVIAIAQDTSTSLFCRLLYFTGARCSEALQVTVGRLDPATGRIVLRTLKRRKTIYRAIPVPRGFLRELIVFAEASGMGPDDRLFPWCRQTAWRRIRALAKTEGIEGPQATTRGFRHGYGCHAIGSGLPESLLSRLLGHARTKTTHIYTFAMGDEERALVERMWRQAPDRRS